MVIDTRPIVIGGNRIKIVDTTPEIFHFVQDDKMLYSNSSKPIETHQATRVFVMLSAVEASVKL